MSTVSPAIELTTTRSRIPSPFKSPAAIAEPCMPMGYVLPGLKKFEPEPGKTVTDPLHELTQVGVLTTATSCLPSRLKSPATIPVELAERVTVAA